MVSIPVNAPGVVEFNMARDAIWLASQGVLAAFLLALTFTGAAARIRDAAARLVRGRRYPALILSAAAYFALAALVVLPFSWALEIGLTRATGRAAAPVAEWLTERAVALAVQTAAAALLLWIPAALIRCLPRMWWFATGAIATLLLTVFLVTEQVVIRPMTTNYVPLAELENASLRADIETLLQRCGAAGANLLTGGWDNTVVGLGPASRILIASWSLSEKTPEQLQFTVAHELKHYLMHDNWLAIGVCGALILAGLFLVHILGNAALRRWEARIHASSLADAAALPLSAAILLLAWTLAGIPAFNATQRWAEIEADRFALEVTRANEAHAQWQTEVANLPDRVVEFYPFYRVFRANHPSEAERIRFANTYRPWESGGALRYARYCEPPS